MPFFLSAIGNEQQFNANGSPLSGGKINTYAAGTTTRVATYTDKAGATEHANPIILNTLGLPANPIWLKGGVSYKFVITDSADVVQRTVDDITGTNDPAVASAVDQWVLFTAVPTFISATSFSLAGDQTNTFQVGRRVKSANTGGAGYHTITASTFASSITTVTVTNDSVVLDTGLSAVSYGLLSAVDRSATAAAISNTPAGGVTELEVQGAINGLEKRKSSIQTNGFRLSLTTVLPVTTADVVGGTTIYAIPYKGNEIALNTGTGWVMHKSAEFSIALSGLVAGRPYDVFCFINASGVPELQVLAWASDTARATAIDYLDGVLKKSGTNTHRYLGTFYTTAATTTEDSAANRYLWNYYHRAARPMAKAGANASWTYSAAVWRQAQGLVANQLNYVVGLVEDGVSATVQTSSINDTATVRNVRVGLGYNSTTAPTGSQQLVSVENSRNVGLSNAAAAMPALGKNFVAWLELGGGADVQTFFGTSTGAIHGVVMA